MKYFISFKQNEDCKKLKDKLEGFFKAKGYVYDKFSPDIVVSIGGDGSFLRSVQDFYQVNPLFISINKGNLGYLCEFNEEDLDLIIDSISNPSIKTISLLELIYDKKSIYALNEVRIEAKHGGSIKFNISVDDELLESIKGDGCNISSSIGSSGINKSLFGSLVDNELEVLQLVLKAPIINRAYQSIDSSFVFNKDRIIKLSSFAPKKFSIFYDCKEINGIDNGDDLIVKISNKKIRVLANKNNNYIAKTKRAFLK